MVFTFANPGRMRVAKEVAVEGGVSDPRNGIMLKIFSMVNFGERAGSGLCSICNVWERVFHTAAVIEEAKDIDRVILTLCYGGHEQDVDAMLRLYETKGELMVVGDAGKYVNGYMEASGNADKLSINMAIRKNTPRSQETSPKLTFAEDISCTPSEGVVFSRHFPTPSEGVGDAHHRYRHQRAIFAENLSCTPSEGVAFSRHSPTPSEGVGDAHHRYGYTENYLNEFTSGCTLIFN